MIRSTIVDGVATLTLDRGGASNALSLKHWDELAAQVSALVTSDARVVVLRSANPASFSAGADLAEMADRIGDPSYGGSLRIRMGAAIEAVASLPMPVIAAIDGACFGAGVALVLACDIRVAGEGARFATPPAKLGISYPTRDVARLSARIGHGQAARLLLTGEAIDADEAVRIGLIELRTTEAAAEAYRMATMIAANDVNAVRILKATLLSPQDPAHDANFDRLFAGRGFADRIATVRTRRT